MAVRKIGTWVFGLWAVASALVASCSLLMLPAAWAQRRQESTVPDVVATIDDAVAACRFMPLMPVRRGRTPVLFLSHFGMILFCGFLEWRALLSGQPLPAWMFTPRSDTAG
jgi:hypothetical protein